jgi:beta-lactamase class A
MALASLAACAPSGDPVPAPTPPLAARVTDRLAELERTYGVRLGVFAVATGSGLVVEHRADERFAFCSTFKVLAAAAVLDRFPPSHLDTVVDYAARDLMESSIVTRQNVSTGMTVRQLCDAAVRFSDGTAGNLLLRQIGGPGALTDYTRRLGDTVTRMNRFEPDIADAVPGDQRDTTSPRAIASDLQALLVDDALPPYGKDLLRDLMQRNATEAGARRIRAGLPPGFTVADKTGTGGYGTANDIAVLWPPAGQAPLVVAVLTTKEVRGAERDDRLLAEAAAHVVAALPS